jgi:hypothetical protein
MGTTEHKVLANISTAFGKNKDVVRPWKMCPKSAHAIKAGFVNEYDLMISPIVVGGGKQSQPNQVRLFG